MSAESVGTAWGELVAALSEKWPSALEALRPPESAERISAAEAATGVTWPEDLRALYRLQGGSVVHDLSAEIWPGGYCPHALDQVVDQHRRSLQIWADDERVGSAPQSAGEPAGTFLSSFVPIALDGSGDFLVVDTRPGPRSGCVIVFDKVDTDLFGSGWPSVAALLGEAAAAVRGEPTSTGYVFDANDPYGRWGFVG